MRRLGQVTALMVVLLAGAGCTSSAMLTASTRPLQDGYTRLSSERVTERAVGFMLLFIPFGRPDPAGRALEACLEGTSANALTEVSVHVSQFSMIAFTIVWTTVSGIPVRAN